MRVAFQSGYYLALPERHPFPMAKYPLLRELLEREQLIEPARIHAPEEAPLELLLRAHTPAYVESFVQGTLAPDTRKALGFEWSPQLLRRARLAVSGTLWACETALEDGLAGNLAGGTHHAFADRGAGYCSFNDVAIALKELLARRAIGRALVVDLDVHQGDGTASIFADDPRVFTFSMHGERNYPLRKQRSSLDVGLADGVSDEVYLEQLERHLGEVIARARADLVVYLAGVDVVAGDRFGRLSLSEQGLAAREQLVLLELFRAGIPCALVLAGGYALRDGQPAPERTAWLHAEVYRAAARRRSLQRSLRR